MVKSREVAKVAKSKYESHVAPNLDKIKRWAEQGATQKEIANKLKLGQSTFKKYLALGESGQEPYVDLSSCFAQACAVADSDVEAAMFKRATGYSYNEDTYTTVIDKKGKEHQVLSKRVVKHMPPDPTSAMFWLTNRQPDKWKYKPEPIQDNEDTGTGVVALPAVMPNPGPPKEDDANG